MNKEWFLDVIQSKEFYVPILTVMFSVLIVSASARIVKKLFNDDVHDFGAKRRRTVVILINNIIKYLVIIIACVVILSSWGVNVSAIIAGLGVAGAVAGLALQDALKDIIMGINIILDNYFVVGDLVTFNDFTGTIIEFGLKSTKIKAVDGTTLIVANREISKIKNQSYKNASIQITIPVAYEEAEPKVKKELERICEEISKWDEVVGEAKYLGISELNTSSVDYMITISSRITDKWPLRRKVLAFIKNEFDKKHIKIPYTQIEVHNGK
ncbi:MAG: mechanosensitive ion channel family protein [Bacilli bacterium]|nr:mechanosensitive ion channel family protein [Bacilli bacterium]